MDKFWQKQKKISTLLNSNSIWKHFVILSMRWLVIFPVDRVIQPLNNWGLSIFLKSRISASDKSSDVSWRLAENNSHYLKNWWRFFFSNIIQQKRVLDSSQLFPFSHVWIDRPSFRRKFHRVKDLLLQQKLTFDHLLCYEKLLRDLEHSRVC